MKYLSIFCLLLYASCGKQDFAEQITHLNGYWEIQSVEMTDGSKKEFNINTTIDFIAISGDTAGVRKKVSPKLDGSFITNNASEKFKIKVESEELTLYYQTPYNEWRETVLLVNQSILKVMNKEGKKYTYRRFRKFGE